MTLPSSPGAETIHLLSNKLFHYLDVFLECVFLFHILPLILPVGSEYQEIMALGRSI